MAKKISKKIYVLAAFALCLVIISTILWHILGTNELVRASKNLTNYSISAEISNNYNIKATQEVDYYNSTGTELENICFHLYPRAFSQNATNKPYTNLNKASCFPDGESFGDILIERADVDGSSANFIFDGVDQDILQINLPKTLSKKSRTKIYLQYSITLPKCTHRFGYYNNSINLGNWYPIVCNFEDGQWDKSPYYSTGDPFVSSCSNYATSITFPAEYSCYSTGNLTNSTNLQETKTNTYNATCVRDFALVLLKNAQEKTLQSKATSITYVGFAGDDNIEHNACLAKEAIECFSKKFGKYPYSSFVAVKSAFLHGGMEYPNLVIISDSIETQDEIDKVIVHEIAHQWWYSAVGNNQITQSWLDESLAEYSTLLFFEDNNKYGQTYADLVKDATASYLIYVDVIGSLNGKVNTAMNLSVEKYKNEYEYTYMVYVKGVIMLDTLRETCGKEKITKALENYYNKYKFKIATEQNLIDSFKKYCHKDLDEFFSGWLSGQSVITATI